MGKTFNQMGWSDRECKVRRLELLEKLKANREQHIQDYKDACAGFKESAIAKLEEALADTKGKIRDLKEGQIPANVYVGISLPAPVSHESAYDLIIKMMEMEVSEEVALTAGQFSCFVMDDWDWKDQWSASNFGYIALAKKGK